MPGFTFNTCLWVSVRILVLTPNPTTTSSQPTLLTQRKAAHFSSQTLIPPTPSSSPTADSASYPLIKAIEQDTQVHPLCPPTCTFVCTLYHPFYHSEWSKFLLRLIKPGCILSQLVKYITLLLALSPLYQQFCLYCTILTKMEIYCHSCT